MRCAVFPVERCTTHHQPKALQAILHAPSRWTGIRAHEPRQAAPERVKGYRAKKKPAGPTKQHISIIVQPARPNRDVRMNNHLECSFLPARAHDYANIVRCSSGHPLGQAVAFIHSSNACHP